MSCRSLLLLLYNHSKCSQYAVPALSSSRIFTRNFHRTTMFYTSDKSENEKQTSAPKELTVKRSFETIPTKNRNTYLEMVNLFIESDMHRRGHVEFIYAALKNMNSFGVAKDLEIYKALIDVLPKGKFIPQNIIQSEFMHYPKQQQCAIDLLEQMEDNGVMPDAEMETQLLNVFGKRGFPLRKFWRMMYWMPKFKNLSPWPVPNPPPNDALELAKLAISRISSADMQAEQTIYQTSDLKDSIDDTWIVSSQSPTQRQLLLKHKKTEPVYIEGSFRVWLRNQCVNYFILRGDPKIIPYEIEDSDDVSHIHVPFMNYMEAPKNKIAIIPSVHEQEDGIIFSLCATGTSSRDSLLSWVRHLEKVNPILKECPVVFTLRSGEKDVEVAAVEPPSEKLADK